MSSADDDERAALEKSCRATFSANPFDNKLADKIERHHPNLQCETVAVGTNSPGRVDDAETLLRVIVSPRDIDPVTGFVHEAPFFKVAETGLSVVRSIASADELRAQTIDGMSSKPGQELRKVHAVFEARVGGEGGIRALQEDGMRLFGVYDQIVPRTDRSKPPVPTHAGVFLRLPPPGTDDRKLKQRDHAGNLRRLFLMRQLALSDLHGGVLETVNEEAALGAFVVAEGA